MALKYGGLSGFWVDTRDLRIDRHSQSLRYFNVVHGMTSSKDMIRADCEVVGCGLYRVRRLVEQHSQNDRRHGLFRHMR